MRLGLNLSVSMGQLVLSLARKFYNLLAGEEAASNTNVFYDPADLTSLRVGRNGSGGNPVVGDPVGIMLDTSQFGGKTAEDYLAGATELAVNGDGSNGTTGWQGDGNTTVSNEAGRIRATLAQSSNPRVWQQIAVTSGEYYRVSANLGTSLVGANRGRFRINHTPGIGSGSIIDHTWDFADQGDRSFIVQATSSLLSVGVVVVTTTLGEWVDIDNLSVKHLPGHHAIAPSDSARPVLLDDPDLTAAALTDNGRGEELSDGVVNLTQGAATINGTEVTFSGQYSNARDVVSVELGSTVQVQITAKALSGNTNLHFFHENSKVVGGATDYTPISLTGNYQTFTLLVQPDQSLMNVGLQDRNTSGFGVCDIQSISVRKVLTAFDERGPELVTNGTFDTDSDWFKGTGWTISGGVASFDAASGATITQTGFSLASGKVYAVSYVTSGNSISVTPQFSGGGGADNGPTVATAGANTAYMVPSTNRTEVKFSALGGRDFSIDNVSVKEVPYPNLLTGDDSTFDTDTGNWTKGTGWSIGSGVASCDGTQVSTSNFSQNIGMVADRWYKFTFYISSISAGQIRFNAGGSTPGAWFTTTGWKTEILRTNAAPLYIQADTSFVGSIDNVIVQELPASIDRKYYLDTDGSDDWMEVKPTLNLGEQWWHVGAWQSDTSGKYVFATTSSFQGGLRHASSLWKWRNAADTGLETLINFDPTTLQVVTVEQAGTNSISGRANGANSAGVITPYDDSGDTQGLALFSSENDRFNGGLDGRFYGGSWGQGQVDYDELTVLQDYLGTTTQPPIDPPDVTEYADVYELLSAQTGAVLFDIDDTTSLRVGRDGSGGVPVDGDPVGMMLDVSDTGGATVAAATAARPELVTNGTFDSDTSGWVTRQPYGTLSVVNGECFIENGPSGGYSGPSQAVTCEIGKVYEVSAYVRLGTGAAFVGLTVGDVKGGNQRGTVTSASTSGETVSFIFTATQTTHYAEVYVATGANNEGYCDNISVKEISSHAAIAPSDSARPTLASVLDTTASELTDDGTRGEELSTTALPVTYAGAGAAVGSMLDAETGANYEITYTISEVTGSPNVYVSSILNPWKYQNLAATVGTHSYTLQANDAGAGSIFYTDATSGSITFSSISVRKVNTAFDERGPELVIPANWTAPSANWTIDAAAGTIEKTATDPNPFDLSGSTETGEFYEYEITVSGLSGGTPSLRDGSGGSLFRSISADGTYRGFYQSSAGDPIAVVANLAVFTISNISVKEVPYPNLLLASNGSDDDSTFDTDTGNWNVAAVSNWSITGGALVADGSASNNVSYSLPIIEPYKWYRVMLYISSLTGSVRVRLGSGGSNDAVLSTTGWHTVITQSEASNFALRCTAGETATIDNVSIQEVPASVARAHYLDFDGADDALYVSLLPDSTFTFSATISPDNVTGTNLNKFRIYTRAESSSSKGALGIDNGQLAITDDGISFTTGGAVSTGQVYTVTGEFFDTVVGRIDGTTTVTLASPVPATSVASGSYIGVGSDGASRFYDGKIFAACLADTRLDGRGRDLLENFMIGKKTS